MRDCLQRDRLIAEWHEAVNEFSEDLAMLRACRDDRRFSEHYKASELARLHAENARMMLEIHRAGTYF